MMIWLGSKKLWILDISLQKCVLFGRHQVVQVALSGKILALKFLKSKLMFGTPFWDLKMIKKVFWQIFDKKQNAHSKDQLKILSVPHPKVMQGLGLVNRCSGSVILVSSRAVNRLTDVNIN